MIGNGDMSHQVEHSTLFLRPSITTQINVRSGFEQFAKLDSETRVELKGLVVRVLLRELAMNLPLTISSKYFQREARHLP